MKICTKCVLPETYPGISFDEKGVCNFCLNEEKSEDRNIFEEEKYLFEALSGIRNFKGKYNVLVPLSGGVDSSHTLIKLVRDYKLRPLVFHYNNGYEDPVATENVKNLCEALDVDLIISQQDNKFMRKLYKYVNESKIKGVNSCYICGNILYINALEVADKYGIPLVINGYSKGQVVQVNDKNKGTELLDLIIQIIKESGDEEFINQFTEKYNILQKRTTFIDKNDLLNFIPDNKKILFIPFYIFKFNKIDKEKLKEQVRKVFDWKTLKTSYPGRTTNCDMIWLNTYVDIQKNGYSNYTVEYAELIRKKEITREQALKDLSFNPLPGELETLARSIGLELALIDNKNEYAPPKTDVKELDIDFEF